jgi:hypothetical protein
VKGQVIRFRVLPIDARFVKPPKGFGGLLGEKSLAKCGQFDGRRSMHPIKNEGNQAHKRDLPFPRKLGRSFLGSIAEISLMKPLGYGLPKILGFFKTFLPSLHPDKIWSQKTRG